MFPHRNQSNVDIVLNQTSVSISGTNYMYKALIENLVHYNENARKIHMDSIGFSGDSGNAGQTHPVPILTVVH